MDMIKYLFTYFVISLLFLSGTTLIAQNSKQVTQQGENNRELIIQYGRDLAVALSQFGDFHEALIFQRGQDKVTSLLQSGNENRAWIYRLPGINYMPNNSLRAFQWGLKNKILYISSQLGNATFQQSGTKNLVFYIQKPDSEKETATKIKVQQSGSGNQTTIIQNFNE